VFIVNNNYLSVFQKVVCGWGKNNYCTVDYGLCVPFMSSYEDMTFGEWLHTFNEVFSVTMKR